MIPKTFTSKLLLSLYRQPQPQGFTFPGFLVRIFLYSSVLTTLLLPFQKFDPNCFLCVHYSSNKNFRESEAKADIVSMNGAQEAYYLEQGKFTFDFPELGLGFHQNNGDYEFEILAPMKPQELTNGNEIKQVVNIAQAEERNYRSYLGSVAIVSDGTTKTEKTIAIICVIQPQQPIHTAMPKVINNKFFCPEGDDQVFDGREQDGIF